MYTHHRFDHSFPPHEGPLRPYVVCSVPRSGSSLLCELLCTSGVAGAPTEYFDREQAAEFRRRWGVDEAEYPSALVAHKTTPNGSFGVKLHHHQMVEAFGDRGLLAVWPDLRLVSIRRDDRVAQAVSWAIAEQTGRWASTHDAPGTARYDRRHVARLLRRIRREEAAWDRWFVAVGIEPLRVTYERLVADPDGVVRAVLTHLGVDATVPLEPPTLERQADEESDRWAARFRRGRAWGGPRR
jgi:LPS sulfotransferase NodH